MRLNIVRTLSLIGVLALGGHANAQLCANGSCGLPGRPAARLLAPFRRAPVPQFVPAAYYSVSAPVVARPAAVVYSTVARVHTRRDFQGREWRHADPAYLAAWVAGRDAAIRTQQARVVATRAKEADCKCNGGPCACANPGDCGRAGCQMATRPASVPVPPAPPTPQVDAPPTPTVSS